MGRFYYDWRIACLKIRHATSYTDRVWFRSVRSGWLRRSNPATPESRMARTGLLVPGDYSDEDAGALVFAKCSARLF